MQSKTGFPSSHQLKSYVAPKPAWNWRRAVLSADAGLLVVFIYSFNMRTDFNIYKYLPLIYCVFMRFSLTLLFASDSR